MRSQPVPATREMDLSVNTRLAALGRFSRAKPLGAVGGGVILLLLVMALFANQLAPQDAIATNGRERLLDPSSAHWFGTDEQGRDILSRIIVGARPSLFIPLAALALATMGSLMFGMVSAYFGGVVDMVVQRIVEAMQTIPPLIIALALLSTLDRNNITMTFTIAFLFIAGPSRVVRGATIGVRNNDYITAARSVGCGNTRILYRYILPNILPTVLVVFSVGIGAAILVISSLDFLGYGIPAPQPTWGGMMGTASREYMQYHPTMALFPGLFIMFTVLGFNLLGDALRDTLDPWMKGR